MHDRGRRSGKPTIERRLKLGMARFQGKVVLITGGTSGIGLALADAFMREGAMVAICARSEDALNAFAADRPTALAIEADVTDVASHSRMLNALSEKFGPLDILVNNAGRLIEREFGAGGIAPEEIAAEFALNLVAPVQLTAAALERWPHLGAIVMISSGYALVSPRRAPTYGAAKAGVHGFADGLRRQLSGGTTHVLEVLPPTVDTPATAHRATTKITAEAVAAATLDALAKRKPVALVGQTRFLPSLLRLAPQTIGRVVGRT
jgi:uncharacterized oxidoreductase